MKKVMLAVIFLTQLSACSAIGRYDQMNDGSYLITVHSNAFASREGIEEEFKEEAEEACNGKYTLKENLKSDVQNIKTYGSTYNTSSNVLIQKRVVACKNQG